MHSSSPRQPKPQTGPLTVPGYRLICPFTARERCELTFCDRFSWGGKTIDVDDKVGADAVENEYLPHGNLSFGFSTFSLTEYAAISGVLEGLLHFQ